MKRKLCLARIVVFEQFLHFGTEQCGSAGVRECLDARMLRKKKLGNS